MQSIPLLAVFMGSLIGSLHCAGMCGGFVACCSTEKKNLNLSIILYHLGRLVVYSLLGFTAGGIGQLFDASAIFIGIQNITALFAGGLLVLLGASILFGKKWLTTNSNFNFLKPIYRFVYSDYFSQPVRSLLLGLCSGLLPCGWLFSFVAMAAASGTPLTGAIIMVFFWAGTVPVLSFIGLTTGKFSNWLKPYQKTLVGLLLVLAGFWSLAVHIAGPASSMFSSEPVSSTSATKSCH